MAYGNVTIEKTESFLLAAIGSKISRRSISAGAMVRQLANVS